MFDRRTLLFGMAAGLAGCGGAPKASGKADEPRPPRFAASGPAARLVSAARAQVGVTRSYDSAYTRLAFPNGDVPEEKCWAPMC